MKRLSLAFLVVFVSVLAFTPMLSAHAEVQLPAYIKFEGYALGRCGLMYGNHPAQPGNWPVEPPPIWYGSAHGSITLEGYAKATDYEEFWGYIAEAGNVKALGSMAVKWSEKDGLHELWIIIYSNPESGGFFGPSEKDGGFSTGFAVPGAIYPTNLLSYTGVFMTGGKVQCTSGQIWVTSGKWPYPPYPDFTQAYLRSEDYAMLIGWVSERTSVYINWSPWTWTIPAAKMVVRNVELL